METIDYKFNEGNLLEEIKEYINSTYTSHYYSQTKIQTTEMVVDLGDGLGFCRGNIMKYIQRYGKKDGFNRKDLLKVLHYALILLHVHDLEHAKDEKVGDRVDTVTNLSGSFINGVPLNFPSLCGVGIIPNSNESSFITITPTTKTPGATS